MKSTIAPPDEILSSLSTPLLDVETKLIERRAEVEAWFRTQWQASPPPLYGSVDLRNAGFKLAPVDTNLFSAGFNNLNPDYMSLYVQAAQAALHELCPDAKRLLLIPESHTRNVFYLENVAALQEILILAGFEVRIGFLGSEFTAPKEFDLPSGKSVTLEPLVRKGTKVGVADYFPCCVVLNNDLSAGIPEMLDGLDQTMMPSIQLGWSTRLKSEHFKYYEEAVREFSNMLDIDPWVLTPLFDQCPEVDFMQKEGQECLQRRAEGLFKQIKKKYEEYGIKHDPFLVIKADQGTYGMAVMMIRSPEELISLNRKQRTRMSTLKGGAAVTKAIIQEGVYSFETAGTEGSVAEPVIYLLGRCAVGGFYRVHDNKGPDENLNSPGMNFHPLPFQEACNLPCDTVDALANRFYIYGVVARLALLAAAREVKMFEGVL